MSIFKKGREKTELEKEIDTLEGDIKVSKGEKFKNFFRGISGREDRIKQDVGVILKITKVLNSLKFENFISKVVIKDNILTVKITYPETFEVFLDKVTFDDCWKKLKEEYSSTRLGTSSIETWWKDCEATGKEINEKIEKYFKFINTGNYEYIEEVNEIFKTLFNFIKITKDKKSKGIFSSLNSDSSLLKKAIEGLNLAADECNKRISKSFENTIKLIKGNARSIIVMNKSVVCPEKLEKIFDMEVENLKSYNSGDKKEIDSIIRSVENIEKYVRGILKKNSGYKTVCSDDILKETGEILKTPMYKFMEDPEKSITNLRRDLMSIVQILGFFKNYVLACEWFDKYISSFSSQYLSKLMEFSSKDDKLSAKRGALFSSWIPSESVLEEGLKECSSKMRYNEITPNYKIDLSNFPKDYLYYRFKNTSKRLYKDMEFSIVWVINGINASKYDDTLKRIDELLSEDIFDFKNSIEYWERECPIYVSIYNYDAKLKIPYWTKLLEKFKKYLDYANSIIKEELNNIKSEILLEIYNDSPEGVAQNKSTAKQIGEEISDFVTSNKKYAGKYSTDVINFAKSIEKEEKIKTKEIDCLKFISKNFYRNVAILKAIVNYVEKFGNIEDILSLKESQDYKFKILYESKRWIQFDLFYDLFKDALKEFNIDVSEIYNVDDIIKAFSLMLTRGIFVSLSDSSNSIMDVNFKYIVNFGKLSKEYNMAIAAIKELNEKKDLLAPLKLPHGCIGSDAPDCKNVIDTSCSAWTEAKGVWNKFIDDSSVKLKNKLVKINDRINKLKQINESKKVDTK